MCFSIDFLFQIQKNGELYAEMEFLNGILIRGFWA
jgi:hypothetical protein